MPFVEPWSVFFDPNGPGNVSATLNGTFSVDGAFYAEYVAPFGAVEMSGSAFECPEVALPDVKHGDTLMVDQRYYTVVGVQKDSPDRSGVVRLILANA